MGRYYWGRKEGGDVRGIVVVFAGMSTQEKQLNSYVQLYASARWNSLICLTEFLYIHPLSQVLVPRGVFDIGHLDRFFPGKAEALAVAVVGELQKELKIRPLPIVFAGFSGGPKSCMYKVLQVEVVKLYSAFARESGTRFILHPRVLKISEPPRILSWIARGFGSGLDSLFQTRFEEQRAEYWRTLYSSVNTGPFLILCSEDDDLAPHQVVCNFAQRLHDLGGNVKLMKWKSSPHVVAKLSSNNWGCHYKHHPDDYRAAVTELLEKAVSIHSQRMRQRNRVGGMSSESSVFSTAEPGFKFPRAAVSSNERIQRAAVGRSEHFLPRSVEYHEGSRGLGSMQDEQKERLLHHQYPPSISVHSVLGKMLFDVVIPKDVEDWDISPAGSSNRQTFAPSHRPSLLNPMKCIRRSRL
ncbi:hypothetical protein ACLOJK_013679 [Asimina triloba]